jgi:hypothetical protein
MSTNSTHADEPPKKRRKTQEAKTVPTNADANRYEADIFQDADLFMDLDNDLGWFLHLIEKKS